MNNLKKISSIIFIVLILILSFFLIFSLFQKETVPNKEGLFIIKKGETLKTISQNLENEEYIKNSRLFYLLFLLNNDPKNIKAGTYKLNSVLSTPNIINQIVKGDVVREKITIPEGWTINEIGEYLENKKICSKKDFFKLAGQSGINHPSSDFSKEFEFLKYKHNNLSLEGFLFPDTYYVTKNDEAKTIIKKMLSNFEKKVWNNIKDKENFYNNLVLASLLEKEVIKTKDKQMVVDILSRRMKNNIPLQVDATTIYANETEKKEFLLNTDINSPFNTYKIKGLPIGPICNPGLDSIEATLNPIKNNYWYYLSAKNKTTIFSRNFEEHKFNKAIYLK